MRSLFLSAHISKDAIHRRVYQAFVSIQIIQVWKEKNQPHKNNKYVELRTITQEKNILKKLIGDNSMLSGKAFKMLLICVIWLPPLIECSSFSNACPMSVCTTTWLNTPYHDVSTPVLPCGEIVLWIASFKVYFLGEGSHILSFNMRVVGVLSSVSDSVGLTSVVLRLTPDMVFFCHQCTCEWVIVHMIESLWID